MQTQKYKGVLISRHIYIELGPYNSVLNIEESSFQGCFNIELGPYKSVLNIIEFKGALIGPYNSVLRVSLVQGYILAPYESVLTFFQGVLIEGFHC